MTAATSPPFQDFSKRIQQRLTGTVPATTLFHSPPETFKPDYLTLGCFGRNQAERKANELLQKHPRLWKNTVATRLFPRVTQESKRLFSSHFSSVSKEFNRTVQNTETLLLTHPEISRKSTFVELFQLMAESLYDLAIHHDINPDCFSETKEIHRDEFNAVTASLREELLEHPKCISLLLTLCTRANWLDLLEANLSEFTLSFLDEINSIIDQELSLATLEEENRQFNITELTRLLTASPKHILIETDNSGEIFFDLLLTEALLRHGHTISIASKSRPVLNDITVSDLNDLLELPQHQVLQDYRKQGHLSVISTGSTSTGKQYHSLSDDYQSSYKKADHLIIKGQGNFQAMPLGYRKKGQFIPIPYKKPISILMGVKAPMIQQSLSRIFSKTECPRIGELFCFTFDSQNPHSWPK